MPDIPGNSSTTSSVFVGGSVSDTLEVAGDRDWIRVELSFGQKVTIFLDGLTLTDAYLRIRDSLGNLLGDPNTPVCIGAEVEGVFEHHEQANPPFTLLQWRYVL